MKKRFYIAAIALMLSIALLAGCAAPAPAAPAAKSVVQNPPAIQTQAVQPVQTVQQTAAYPEGQVVYDDATMPLGTTGATYGPAADSCCGDTGCGDMGCGPYMGCGPWMGCPMAQGTGIIPSALRFTGRVFYGAGQIVAGTGRVIAFGAESAVRGVGMAAWGTGRVAVGAGHVAVGTTVAVANNVRTAGQVFVSGPCGPIGCSPYGCATPMAGGCATCGQVAGNTPAAVGTPTNDMLYMENDSYLQMDLSRANRSQQVSASYPSSAPSTQGVFNSNPTQTAGLLSTQTQHVRLDDGTEVILQHDNAPVQYNPVSYNNMANAPASDNKVPVTNGQVSAEGYPIVAAETPNIQLAPGEVLVSQQDFILTGPENSTPTPLAPKSDDVVPLQPITPDDNNTVQNGMPQLKQVSFTTVSPTPTASHHNWQTVAAAGAEPSFLNLKTATSTK